MDNFVKKLNTKIAKRCLNIGVIGIGYVGIKLVLAFSKRQNLIYCFDQDKNKISRLKKGKSPYSYINDSEIKSKLKYLNLENKLININKCDVIIFCLPTPLKKEKPDLSNVKKGWKKIQPLIKPGQLIILESTVYPGCTEEIFVKFLKKNFELDNDIFLSYSPERENPGDKKFSFKNTPKVVSGIKKNSSKLAASLYKIIVNKVVESPSIKIAETSKLLENIYRSVNIALINELKIACDNLGIDIYKVIDIASTKPFGFQKFAPGPGTGGHCIPIDPTYFSWLSAKKGFNVKFIELSAKINSFRTRFVTKKIEHLIKNYKTNKKKILVLGLSYKKNIEDSRESASVKIFQNLKSKKFQIDYCDPFIKNYEFIINKKKILIKSKKIQKNIFNNYQFIIIATDHDKFNYKNIINSKKIIIDLRGRFRDYKQNNIISI
mgnify:CR=1 FL=1